MIILFSGGGGANLRTLYKIFLYIYMSSSRIFVFLNFIFNICLL